MKINNKIDFDIFIKGEEINLVVLTEEIVKKTNWYKWFNDQETTYHMQQHYYPNTLEDQIKFFHDNLKNNDMLVQLGIVHKTDKVFCGIVSIGNINNFNHNADISLMIGEKKYRVLDIAYEVMKLIINHSFQSLNLHKVSVGYVATLKPWGLFLQNSFGFVEEGIQREHAFKNGKYIDIVNLGLTINDYKQKVHKKYETKDN